MEFKASSHPYSIVRVSDSCHEKVYPLLRNDMGDIIIECISPIHGRSFVVGKTDQGRYIVSKGNGLSYSTKSFSALAKDSEDSLWGALNENSAIRDFLIGQEAFAAGIRTNHMEYVLKLDCPININGKVVLPYLLQYDLECPFRITDFAFVPKNIFYKTIEGWELLNELGFKEKYLIAAYTLIKNLHILRKNNILHNALHAQNYTWGLELLDFESSRSNKMPYDNPDYESCAKFLSEVEIVQTYDVINYISWCLKENIDYSKVEKIFKHFDINHL